MMELDLTAFLIAAVTGVVTSVGTVAALKTDIQWLKKSVKRVHERVDRHEGLIDSLLLRDTK